MSILGRIIMLGNEKDATKNSRYFGQKNWEVAEICVKVNDIRKKYDLALQGFHVDREIEINKLSYHWLNLKPTHNSALILLNRIVSPEIRTGEELQKAASEILQITLQLEHANMMHNPYVITSQFFMFVAGIEMLDPIYQQWTLTILKELQNWGENMHHVIKLLESIFLLQEQREVRINNTTGDIIQDGYHELGAYLEERYTEQWPTVSMAGGLISNIIGGVGISTEAGNDGGTIDVPDEMVTIKVGSHKEWYLNKASHSRG
ncbi:hypothetical protein V8C40DRAFT_266885 [Trichoderma camerunense]